MSGPARIVVFGATGYTGTLVARALVAQGARPVLAGRSRDKLAGLADALGGLETHIADIADPASLRAAIGHGDVLISTVGPFLRWGDAAVEAAIDARATYLDSTGEPAFIRKVFEHYGPQARQQSSALMTAYGFDWVPGNLAATLALSQAGSAATRVEVAYLLNGTSAESGGAEASAAAAIIAPSFAFRQGRLITERTAARARRVRDTSGRPRWILSAGGTEHLTLPEQFPHLRDIEVGLGLYGAMSAVVPYVSATLNAGMRIPAVAGAIRGAMERKANGSSGGPSDEARAAGSTSVIARAWSDSDELLHTTLLTGVDGFSFTANFLAWASIQAAGGITGTGALGPVQAFGVEALEEGVRESGLVLVN